MEHGCVVVYFFFFYVEENTEFYRPSALVEKDMIDSFLHSSIFLPSFFLFFFFFVVLRGGGGE